MWDSIEALLDYAKLLEKSTVYKTKRKNSQNPLVLNLDVELKEKSREYNGKGQFGNYLEEQYFGKQNDTESLPDFNEVGVELKVSPLIYLQKGEIRVKERLVLNQFTFTDIAKETFENSHFKVKDALILIIFYFHNNEKAMRDKEIYLVDLWETLKNDIDQIKEDWETIVNKVRQGKAHEISEGDTLYLGACTKGSTALKSMQVQPYSPIKAKSRALCFKTSYINHIFKVLVQKQSNQENHENRFLKNYSQTISYKIEETLTPYKGKTGKELSAIFNVTFNYKYKSRYADFARLMIGLKGEKDNFYEFAAANIQIKSIRIGKNGLVKEAMSFKNIVFTDIVDEEWEDSTFYQELTSKFIFVFFKQTEDDDNDYFYDDFLLWNMPEKDLEKAKDVWLKTKELIMNNCYTQFPGASKSEVAHVRPKATNAKDLMITPMGTLEKKKCFWLNNSYIRENIVNFKYKDKDKTNFYERDYE